LCRWRWNRDAAQQVPPALGVWGARIVFCFRATPVSSLWRLRISSQAGRSHLEGRSKQWPYRATLRGRL
jgi:hypothetical protein